MDDVKAEEFCFENKQSDVTSSCSVSDGSCGAALKSPGVSSPATTSPSHRRTTGPIRRAKGGWTPEEDETLRNAVQVFKGKCWKKIAEFFPDRSEVQCLHRWQKVLNPELIKGPWTQEEDDKIIELVSKYGPTKWSVIAKSLPGRIGKQCRERWHNHLNPMIKKDAWTLEEELLLMNAQRVHGNKWAEIAKVIPGRTDNSIKNHWNSSLKKKLGFYLATGQLPSVPKTDPDIAKDMVRVTANGNFFSCSSKGLDIKAAESPLADLCKVEAYPHDQFGSSMQQCLDIHTSSRRLIIGPDNTDECEPQVVAHEGRGSCGSELDFCHSNYDTTPISIKCRNNRESDQDKNILRTPLHRMVPAFGSSFHESPQSGSSDIPLDPSILDKFRLLPQTNDSSLVMSPKCFSTPPCAKGADLGWQIAESILKNAAKSFPNTPSILRKRKRDARAQLSIDRIREAEVSKVKNSLHTPEQIESNANEDRSRSINSSSCEGSNCHGMVTSCSGRDFNTSPPYRLRSKRTAVFKSIEKQLDFTSDKVKFDSNNQSMNANIKANPHVTENCPQTMKLEVT